MLIELKYRSKLLGSIRLTLREGSKKEGFRDQRRKEKCKKEFFFFFVPQYQGVNVKMDLLHVERDQRRKSRYKPIKEERQDTKLNVYKVYRAIEVYTCFFIISL